MHGVSAQKTANLKKKVRLALQYSVVHKVTTEGVCEQGAEENIWSEER
jgi:hypothetical protein